MSDPQGGGATTSLEEVFTARAFARQHCGGVPHQLVRHPFVATEDMGMDGALEEVFLSAQFGKPLTLVRPSEPAVPRSGAASAAKTVVVPFPTLAQHNRYRAVAAASSIAAAALVVAGVSSGTGHQRPPEVAAQGPRVTTQVPLASRATPGGSSAGITASTGTTAPATLADTGASSPAPAVGEDETLRSNNSSNAATTGSGASAPPPLTPSGGNPVAAVVTSLTNTVTGVDTSVTTATGQVASSLPAVATVTGAFTGVSASVVGVTQSVSSTTR